MIYSQEYIKKLQEENKKLSSEISILKAENRDKRNYITDLEGHSFKNENITLKNQNDLLKDENAELKKKVIYLEEQLGIVRISLGKDSSNSSKPSSTDGFKKVIQNNRVKSGKKPGREKGHPRSAPVVSETPDEIIQVSKVNTCTCGCHTVITEEVRREVVSIKVITYRTQYVGRRTKCPSCGKEYSPKFPKELKNTVQYDESIKSLLVYLNTYCNVPNEKVADFIKFLTKSEIKIAPATVINSIAQFGKKSGAILEKIKQKVLKSPVIYEDESPIDVNGKTMSLIGVYTNSISLTCAFANRKMESFKEMGILNRYIGTVCHDHNNIHKSFIQSKQAECNAHPLRYCKAEYEVHKRESIKKFIDYMLILRDKVDEYKLKKLLSFSQEEYEEARKQYIELLSNWDKEYETNIDRNKPKYYESERCLKARLREYVDDHLRFLTDFRIDFTNNLAERRITSSKNKTKSYRMF
jgi:transposase